MEAKPEGAVGPWKRLQAIDTRMIYLLLIIIIAIPFLRPLGIPIEVTKPVQDFYNKLDGLAPGSALLIDVASGPAAYGEIGPGVTAFMDYVTRQYPERHGGKRLKLIFISSWEEGPIMYNAYAKPKLDQEKYQYGVEYAYFGFISGGETFVARLAENIPTLLRSDAFGNSIDKLAVMGGINDYRNIAAIVSWDSSGVYDWYVRHWSPKGVKTGTIIVAYDLPKQYTFYNSGDLYGFLGSSRGGAEFEFLIKRPGVGLATTDTLSMSHLLLIALIALGNVAYFMHRAAAPRRSGGS